MSVATKLASWLDTGYADRHMAQVPSLGSAPHHPRAPVTQVVGA